MVVDFFYDARQNRESKVQVHVGEGHDLSTLHGGGGGTFLSVPHPVHSAQTSVNIYIRFFSSDNCNSKIKSFDIM